MKYDLCIDSCTPQFIHKTGNNPVQAQSQLINNTGNKTHIQSHKLQHIWQCIKHLDLHELSE